MEINSKTNSIMQINRKRPHLNKSFTKLLPPKPLKIRNQSTKEENKENIITNDLKNNANLNISYQKTFSLFNESNYDSNCQTNGSSNIKRKQRNIKYYYMNNNQSKLLYKKKDIKDMQTLNTFYSEKDNLSKIVYIQNWWKTTNKIIFIQKYVRSYLVKHHISLMVYFIKNIYKILFKLIIKKIKSININNKIFSNITENKNIIKNKSRQYNNYRNIKKNRTTSNFNKDNSSTNNYLFSESNINKKIDEIKIIRNRINVLKNNSANKTINMNKTNNHYIPINNNKDKCYNKNKKLNKEKKDKEINQTIYNKDQLIANKIYSIYNNVKKFYEKDNNNKNANFFTTDSCFSKNNKNSNISNNNNKIKTKKINKPESMKNITEKNILNVNNINMNVNINNNKKLDKKNSKYELYSPGNKGNHSIYYLLKLKKAFLYWNNYLMKKNIIQKLKIIKRINTPNNIKKTISIYNTKRKEEEKSPSITITKKVNISNSLIDIKLNKNTSQKIKESNIKPNSNFTTYTKHLKGHIRSIGYNNSMINLKIPKSSINKTLNNNKEKKISTYYNNKGLYGNIYYYNSINVNKYNRNDKDKKKEIPKSYNKSIDVNENKKIYYFYSIINLIDEHNNKRKIKKYFNIWKSIIKYVSANISTNNNKRIEEKIISFKSIKSPFKNNLNENKFNKNNPLLQNNSLGNFNCQTEGAFDPNFCHYKSNSIINQPYYLSPNPNEKSIHPNYFNSNCKAPKIVYQKKFLASKKIRNQSNNSKTNAEENENIILMNSENQEQNLLIHNIGNNLYKINSYMTKNNNDYNALFFKKNSFERINEFNETGQSFIPKSKIHTTKNSFVMDRKYFNDVDNGYILNNKKINVNVTNYYNKNDLNDVDIDNSKNNSNINNKKSKITTKQIYLRNRICKNYSHSQEFNIDNQSF